MKINLDLNKRFKTPIILAMLLFFVLGYIFLCYAFWSVEPDTVNENRPNISDKNKQSLSKERKELISKIHSIKTKRASDIKSYITTNYKRVPIQIVDNIANDIVKLCNKHKIPHSLIVGMMEVESAFNPMAVSNKKARGLMQVRFSVWKKELKLTNKFQLHEIETGIESGILVLKHYLGGNGNDLYDALYRYVGRSTQYIYKVQTATIKFMMYEASQQENYETPQQEDHE